MSYHPNDPAFNSDHAEAEEERLQQQERDTDAYIAAKRRNFEGMTTLEAIATQKAAMKRLSAIIEDGARTIKEIDESLT